MDNLKASIATDLHATDEQLHDYVVSTLKLGAHYAQFSFTSDVFTGSVVGHERGDGLYVVEINNKERLIELK